MATVQFNLRIPEELKNKVDEASKQSGRSINAEATYRLEQSFNQTLTQDERMEYLEKELSETKKVVAITAGFFEDLLGEKNGEYAKYFYEKFPQFKDENKKPTA